MRTFTEKDYRGILVAFRTFLRAMNGERLPQKAGDALIRKAVDNGICMDVLFNVANWNRAAQANGETPLTAEEYVEALCSRHIEAHPLKDEPNWAEPDLGGFRIVAEAVHDFYVEVTGTGGKWNTPSAMKNLARAIRSYSLQALMSEENIRNVTTVLGMEEAPSFFAYTVTIANDFNSLEINDGPTEAQEMRRQEDEAAVKAIFGEEEAAAGEETPSEAEAEPEDEARPENKSPEEDPQYTEPEENYPVAEAEPSGGFFTAETPNELKRRCVSNAILTYTVEEIGALAAVTDTAGKEEQPRVELVSVINDLTLGQFDVKKEDQLARDVHAELNNDLMPDFIACVRMQGVEMNEQLAEKYDVLRDSWDMRTSQTRKLLKLKKLIYDCGQDDPDLLEAVSDIESLYL